MRTVAGLNKNSLLDFSKPLQVHFHQQLASLTTQDLLRESGDYISLTREGQMLSDYIISQLFFTE
jgi:coproporphyrinogen III oxidase-like Fe-S oxidoreductase